MSGRHRLAEDAAVGRHRVAEPETAISGRHRAVELPAAPSTSQVASNRSPLRLAVLVLCAFALSLATAMMLQRSPEVVAVVAAPSTPLFIGPVRPSVVTTAPTTTAPTTTVAPPAAPVTRPKPAPVTRPKPTPAPAPKRAPAPAPAGECPRTGFGLKPHVAQVAHQVAGLFDVPDSAIGGYRSNAIDRTGHPAGLAVDFSVNREKGDEIAAYLLANKSVLAIKYVIWRQRINYGAGWVGMSDRGSITANHFDHVHASFNAKASGTPILC